MKDRDLISNQAREYLTTGKIPENPEALELVKKLTEFSQTFCDTGYFPGEEGIVNVTNEDICINRELRDYYSKGIKPLDPKTLQMIEDNEKDRQQHAEEIEKAFLESDPDYQQFIQDKQYLS